MTYNNIQLIINKNTQNEKINEIQEYLKEEIKIPFTILPHDTSHSINDNSLFLLYLNDNEIKTFFSKHLDMDINVAIISNDTCPSANKNYSLEKNYGDGIEDALNKELISKIDLLKCNELIAFNSVNIGDMHGMNRINFHEKNKWQRIQIVLRNLKNIKFNSYTITTSKEQTIKTAASGINIIEHTIVNDKAELTEGLSFHDGKLNAFILAPTSLLSYIWYLISIFFYKKISLIALPKSLGFIKSSKLNISSTKEINYLLDGVLLSSKEVCLEVAQDCINLHLGRTLKDYVQNGTKEQVKDTIKINQLPNNEVSSILIEGKLPLFKKASDEDFKDLFLSLKDSSKLSYVFLVLMVLSTLLASTGLFASSAPVIIGAMILAPLMSPIISLSMGVVRAENILVTQSLRTLFIGISTALFFSFIYSSFIPLQQITPEMQSRLSPNMLDLMVAIFSGIAGAYASSKEEIAKSLAGVAIAVALVPPLSVTGIGMAFGNIDMIYLSFLLFLTNLVGITLSASLTFVVLGYAPVKRAKKGIFYASILLTIIVIPLYLSFMHMVENNTNFNKINKIKNIEINNKKVSLNIISLQSQQDNINLELEVVSKGMLNQNDLGKIKKQIQDKVDKKLILTISPKIIVD